MWPSLQRHSKGRDPFTDPSSCPPCRVRCKMRAAICSVVVCEQRQCCTHAASTAFALTCCRRSVRRVGQPCGEAAAAVALRRRARPAQQERERHGGPRAAAA
eukprot:6198659-Pleurochrysis_carterae.AAC.1